MDLRDRRPDPDVVDALQRRAEDEGSVPVIVGVRTHWHPDAALSAAERAAERDRQARQKAHVLDEIVDTRHAVRQDFGDFVPFVSVEVDVEGLRRLETSPHVATLEEVELLEPSLADSVEQMGASQAWAAGYDGTGQAVAILDTGVQADHPTFGNRVVAEGCFSWAASCPSGETVEIGPGAAAPCTYDEQSCLHGTHVAGIAAGADPAGVAPAADVVAAQVFSRYTGSVCGFSGGPCALSSAGDYLRAMRWVHDVGHQHGVAAVNLSLGGGFSRRVCDFASPASVAAVAQLHASGIAVVAATGNDGGRVGVSFPACLSQVVRVGNGTFDDRVHWSSNSGDLVSLVAPGSFIESSVPGGTAALTGTSMAAPHVAGAWAVLRQADPTASVPAVLGALTESGDAVRDHRNGVVRPRPDLAGAPDRLGEVPDNDDVADASTVSGDHGVVFGTTVGATREPDEPDHGAVGGTSSTWYRWTAPADGIAAFDTIGSSFDTALGVYTGTATDDLASVATNDDAAASVAQSRVEFPVTGGQDYLVAIDGADGGHGAVVLRWHFGPPANDEVADATVLTGTSGSITGVNLGATKEFPDPFGTDHVGSTWFRWTAPVDGTAAFDTLGSDYDTALRIFSGPASNLVLEASAGKVGTEALLLRDIVAGTTYHVAVTGFLGDGLPGFGAHRLSWTQEVPANNTFDHAEVLTGPDGSTSTSSAHRATDEPGSSRTGVWYRYTAPVDGALVVDTLDSDFETTVRVYRGDDVSSLEKVAEGLDDGPLGTSRVRPIGLLAGDTVHIHVTTFRADAGDVLALNWRFGPPPNDDLADARALEPVGSLRWTNLQASAQPGEPEHGEPGGSSVWFTLEPEVDGRVLLKINGLDATAGVYTGDHDKLSKLSRAGAARVWSSKSVRGSGPTFVSFATTAGTTYRVAVDGRDGATSAGFDLDWAMGPTNDDFDDATVLTGDRGSVDGDTRGATLEPDEEDLGFGNPERSVWYRWTAPADGRIVVDLLGRPGTAEVQIATGDTIDELDLLASHAYRTDLEVTAGDVYHFQVNDDPGHRDDPAPDAFTLRWRYASAHDDPATALVLTTAAGSIEASNEGGTARSDLGESASPSGAGASVWYRWTAPGDGRYTFDTLGSDHDTQLTVYSGDSPNIDELTVVADDIDGGLRWTSSLRLDAVSGTEYLIEVDGPGHKFCCSPFFPAAWVGTHDLNWAPTPTNDDAADASVVAGAVGTVTGSTVGATRQDDEPGHASATTARSVWYRWTAPAEGALDVWVDADFDTVLGIYPGVPLVELRSGGVDVRGDGGEEILDRDVRAGEELLFLVDAYAADAGTFDLHWAFDALNHPPVAHDQTVDARVETPIEITLDATDVDGDRLAHEIVSLPAHGTLYEGDTKITRVPHRLQGDGDVVTYISDPLYDGADRFDHRAFDGEFYSDPATVTVSVAGPSLDELAFTSRRDGNHELYLWRRDGTDSDRLTDTSAWESGPAFSPDGDRLAFARADRVYIRDMLTGSETGPVLDLPSYAPAWSPDGRALAMSVDDGGGDWEIFVVEVATGDVHQVTDNTVDDFDPDWSPDGSSLVLTADGGLTILDLHTGGRATMSQAGTAWAPDWSPDGTRIAYAREESGGGWALAVLDLDTDTVGTLLTDDRVNSYPEWSPDGTRIAFAASDDGFKHPWGLAILDVEAGSVESLADAGSGWEPSWRLDPGGV